MPERNDAKPRAEGRARRQAPRRVARVVQWGALAVLLGSMLVWARLVLGGAGEIAAQVLADDPGAAPVEVLASPRILEVGQPASPDAIERELGALGYRAVTRAPREPGEYRRAASGFEIFRRAHAGPAGDVEQAFIRARIEEGHVASLERADGRDLRSFAMEPVRLGAFRGPQLEERRPLPLNRFPARLVQAVMAAEDARFLRHRGVDPQGVLRALWHDLHGGGRLQGGSTITQQVIKNRIVGRERTFMRKAHEAALAAYIEGRVSKERLLEIYLNEIYLGQRGAVSVVGMPAGALHYFGKNVDDLDLNQMALLAGLIASPGRFDPRRDPEGARSRMQWVLSRMVELGWIDQAEAQAAGRAPLGLAPLQDALDPAGDVLDAVRRDLEARGYEPQPGRTRALIHTTLDMELQAAARHALEETLESLEQKDPRRVPLDGAVVILRPGTGEILALVGGRQGVRGGFNRAIDARRQPGSAFKPFVALSAFASGTFVPASVLDDAPLSVQTVAGPWTPENFDRRFRGPVSVRQALEQSLNVPTARLGLAVGPPVIVEWAHKAGIVSGLPAQPSLALGAGEVTPLELANAYATLVTLGQRRHPLLVRGVRTGPGEDPVALAPVARMVPDALPAAACWMVLDCLTGVIERGTAKELSSVTGGVRVAAKTGTTQDGRDAWFGLLGGRAVVVVYIGRDDHQAARLTGAGAALPVVYKLLVHAGPRLLGAIPDMPAGLTTVEIDPQTGGAATSRCPTRVTEVFPEDRKPGTCPLHQSKLRKLWNRLRGK